MIASDKFWDKTAQRYSAASIADEATYQKKLAETQQLLQPHMRILEFGCGTGTTAVQHAPHVLHIDAIDISEKMLEIGRANASAAKVNNITFKLGTLSTIDAAANSLDAILGLNVLHLIADRAELLAEAARILKPGGVLISSTACLGQSYLRFIKLAVPLGKALGLMPDVYVLSENQLAEEMRAAGFDIERQWDHGKHAVTVFMVARKPVQNSVII